VHGKKVDWISHWHEEGYLSFNVRFTDGKNFSILCSPTIVTNVVDFSDQDCGAWFVRYRERVGQKDGSTSFAGGPNVWAVWNDFPAPMTSSRCG
jgi:hypothetical protein